MVHDIQAVNRFVAAGKAANQSGGSVNATVTDMLNCDYIECVDVLCIAVKLLNADFCLYYIVEEAQCPTSQLERSGRCSTGY
jgi:hypothetical protein